MTLFLVIHTLDEVFLIIPKKMTYLKMSKCHKNNHKHKDKIWFSRKWTFKYIKNTYHPRLFISFYFAPISPICVSLSQVIASFVGGITLFYSLTCLIKTKHTRPWSLGDWLISFTTGVTITYVDNVGCHKYFCRKMQTIC